MGETRGAGSGHGGSREDWSCISHQGPNGILCAVRAVCHCTVGTGAEGFMRGAATEDAECDSGKAELAKGREASYHRSANRSGMTGREEKVKLENALKVKKRVKLKISRLACTVFAALPPAYVSALSHSTLHQMYQRPPADIVQ